MISVFRKSILFKKKLLLALSFLLISAQLPAAEEGKFILANVVGVADYNRIVLRTYLTWDKFLYVVKGLKEPSRKVRRCVKEALLKELPAGLLLKLEPGKSITEAVLYMPDRKNKVEDFIKQLLQRCRKKEGKKKGSS